MVPVVCVAVLGGWFILRPDKAQNANTDINYVQVSPSKRDVSNTLSGTGTLNPANTYNVKSLVAGKVLTSSFEEGDIVEEGTVLYTVDCLRCHHQGGAGVHCSAAGTAQLRQDGRPPVCPRRGGRCCEVPSRWPRVTK